MAATFAGAQSISFSGSGSFASGEVEKDGMDAAAAFAGNMGSANATLYDSNYGSITTGNTLSRADFMATMSAAFSGGYGGVFGMDTADQQGDYNEIILQTGLRNVSITPGPNNYAEGGNSQGYKGKEGTNFDGTGPSPTVDADPPRALNIGTSGSKAYIGDSFLGGATSFHLDFDIADEVSVIGFAFLNYENFQSFQRGNSDYPNIHARVVWSDGTTDITQQSVQFSQQAAGGDVYFGFQQPGAGYYVDDLSFYTIGNNGRAWVGADELGIALGDGAAVPEPRVAALVIGLVALGGVWLRRRRR